MTKVNRKHKNTGRQIPCLVGSRAQPGTGYRRWSRTDGHMHSWRQKYPHRWRTQNHVSRECCHCTNTIHIYRSSSAHFYTTVPDSLKHAKTKNKNKMTEEHTVWMVMRGNIVWNRNDERL